jgi:ribosome biogenesis GTPase
LAEAALLHPGLVVASYGRHVLVEDSGGQRLICHPRGKKNACVVGDRVQWMPSDDEGSIEHIEARRNLFYRQDEVRTKSFAANLDQILILIAAEPEYSESQVARALIAANAQHIPAIIGLNKCDLTGPFEQAWDRLGVYRRMGYDMLRLSLKPRGTVVAPAEVEASTAALLERLHNKTTLVLGPSGTGKSTLINRMVPDAAVLTAEISQALNSGKHTTTSTTWYWVDAQHHTALIDSPGFQEFGLRHLDAMHLASYMPDIAEHANQCKFYNCTHLHEPGCSVLARVSETDREGHISQRRHAIYRSLFAELSQTRY